MEERWIDAHSVNCFDCGQLVDERDCIDGPDGEGSICPRCQGVRASAREMLTALLTIQTWALDPDSTWAMREIEALADRTISKAVGLEVD